jgi:hypothetical protein
MAEYFLNQLDRQSSRMLHSMAILAVVPVVLMGSVTAANLAMSLTQSWPFAVGNLPCSFLSKRNLATIQ